WSLGFPQVTAGATVLGPHLGDLPDILNYDDIEDSRKQEILNQIPASGSSLDVDVRAPLVTLQNRNFALGVAYGFLGSHSVDRDVVDLFFNGYTTGRRDYTVQNTRGSRATFWDFAAAYGRSVGPVSVGATGHYYLGRGLVQTRAFAPTYFPLGTDVQVEYVGVGADGGHGFGLDVGAAMEPVPGLTLSAAVANVASSMTWSDDRTGRRIVLTNADFQAQDFQSVLDRYDESEQDLGTTPTGRFAEVAQGLTDDTDFPTTLRLGAAFALPGGLTTVSGQYQDNLTEGRLSGSWDRLLGLGVQQRLGFLTARVGLSSDLDDANIVGGGLTLGPVDLGLAKFTNGKVDDASRNGWMASFGLSVRARRL
ncbi:MAG: hypothetical protein JO040_06620, partial [Gemmatimonadetes bacterium]|nr:hypothetical protein [Gemmatimonadota bacterium]